MKQGGLYQNKVNSSLASIFNYKMGYSKEQRGATCWNKLPKDMKEVADSRIFKKSTCMFIKWNSSF